MNCDWCGANPNRNSIYLTKYKVKGIDMYGKKRNKTINICNCCDAWGILSENDYEYDQRMMEMTGLDEAKIL